jgi:hypothetical protein
MYKLAYGEFEDEYPTVPERIVFFISTIALPLIMLNMLIAIMSDIYTRVLEQQVIVDAAERLRWILEVGRISFW